MARDVKRLAFPGRWTPWRPPEPPWRPHVGDDPGGVWPENAVQAFEARLSTLQTALPNPNSLASRGFIS
jgi:hypothetical protein